MLNEYKNHETNSGCQSVKFTKSGKYLFGGYDDPPHILCWDTLSGNTTQPFTAINTPVTCLDINSNGNALATGSWDLILRIWA